MWQDTEVSTWVLENISEKYPFIGKFAKLLSNACEKGILWIVITLAIIAYYYFKKKNFKYQYIIGALPILFIWLFCEKVLKINNARIRPFEAIEGFKTYMDSIAYAYPKSYSFPSGHSVVAFAFATLIALEEKEVKVTGCILTLALLVGLSRIVLGAHYLSDVLAGGGIGAAGGVFAYVFAHAIDKYLIKKYIIKEKEPLCD